MASEWYVRFGNAEQGPISSETLKLLAKEGKVKHDTPVKKGASSNWVLASRVKGLVISVAEPMLPQPTSVSVPPPMPAVQPMPTSESVPFRSRQQAEVLPSPVEEPCQVCQPPMGTYQKVLLGIGTACLTILVLSLFLTWVNVLGGGMLGIELDGKIIYVVCLGVAAGLVTELVMYKRVVISVFCAQSLGTIACLLMISYVRAILVFRAVQESLNSNTDISAHIIGRAFVFRVTPGIGLILGMFGSIGMAIVFAIVAIQCLKKARIYFFTQMLSILVGISIVATYAAKGSLAVKQGGETSLLTLGGQGMPFDPSVPPEKVVNSTTVDDYLPPVAEWVDAKSPTKLGDVKIQVIGVVIEKVRLESFSGMGESKDKLCQISLRVTNDNPSRKIDYRGWQGNAFTTNAKLTDDIGNRYKVINFGLGNKVIGQVESESIYPSKSIDELLIFEAPVDDAKHIQLELPGDNIGETGKIRLSISRDFWNATKGKKRDALSSSNNEWADATKPVQRGDIQIKVARVYVGKVFYKSLGSKLDESETVLCQITLQIKNLSSTNKGTNYRGWQNRTYSSYAQLTDDLGNHYKAINFGLGTLIDGQLMSKYISPGKSVEDLLVFEVPASNAKYLNLELPASNIGQTENIRLRIPRGFTQMMEDKAEE